MSMDTTHRDHPALTRPGVTLVEAILAVALVSVLVLMSLNSMGSIAKGRQDATLHYQGMMLAEQLDDRDLPESL